MDHFRILSCARTGKHILSLRHQNFIDKQVAYHLGTMKHLIGGQVDEIDHRNADETLFMINMDNGHTLEFFGESDVKYANVVSSGEGLTMIIRINEKGGGIIHPAFIVFKN